MTVVRPLLLSAVLLAASGHCGNAVTLQGGVEQNQVTTGGGGESEPYQVDGQCWAACNAAADWQKASLSADQRTRSSTCLSYLDSAHSYEEQINNLQQQSVSAGKARNFSQRDELSRQAHELVTPRDQQIADFAACTKVALANTPADASASQADSTDGTPSSQGEPANPEPPGPAGPAYADSPYGPLQSSASVSGNQPTTSPASAGPAYADSPYGPLQSSTPASGNQPTTSPASAGPAYADSPYGPLQSSTPASGDQPAASPTLLHGHAGLPGVTSQPTYSNPVAVPSSTGGTGSKPVQGGVSSAGGFKNADFYPDGIHVHLQIQNDDPPDKKFDGQPLELNRRKRTPSIISQGFGVSSTENSWKRGRS